MTPGPHILTAQLAELPPRCRVLKRSRLHSHNPGQTSIEAGGIEALGRMAAAQLPAIVLAFVVLLAPRTEAAVSFSNPIRKVSSSNNKGALHEIESTGFDPFNEVSSVAWEEYWAGANTTGQYIAEAAQNSMIGLSGISVSGRVSETGSPFFWGSQRLEQSAVSRFSVGFTVGSPRDLILTGTVNRFVDYGGTNASDARLSVILMHGGDEIYSFMPESDPYPPDYTWEYRQIDKVFHSIEPGEYQLIIEATANGNYDDYSGEGGIGGSGNLSYDISLVPEPMTILLACLGGLLFTVRRSR